MSLTLDNNTAHYQIRAYQPGLIQINEFILTDSIIITPTRLIQNWQPKHISLLTPEDLLPILDLQPAILLIGTGSTLEFPQLKIYGDLINKAIGVEIMETGAACRTFSALTAEGRNVAAALIVK